MNNASYWKERFKTIEESQHKRGLKCYANIEEQYQHAQREIEQKINLWYQRFADNNNISLMEARKLLNSEELEELKWDVEEYIRYGKANALNQQWMDELENASAKAHINRLEAIKLQMQQSLEVAFGNQLDTVDKTIRDIYRTGYLYTAFEIQKGIGIGWNLATPNDRIISQVINKPWSADGRTFSDRIWTNKQKLINELNTTFTQGIITGSDPQRTINAISKKLAVSKQQAGRLVMTEQAAFSNAAQNECFKELGVEEFEIVETLDSHTCAVCGSFDGKHFPMSQFEIGVNAPPFHPNCRGCTCPYFDDEFTFEEKRSARNSDDEKTYRVPGNMSYEEWKKSFVEGTDAKEDNEQGNKEETLFDRKAAKKEINNLRASRDSKQKKLESLSEEEKTLTQKCYFDMTGTPDEINRLHTMASEKKNIQTEIEKYSASILEKQNLYKTEVEKQILDSGIIKEIRLSDKMTPETVDEIEDVLNRLNSRYGKMPEAVVYSPAKVGDGTAQYNWLDDKIYISNKLCDSNRYKEFVRKAEDSLDEYRKHYQVVERAKKDIGEADKILSNAGIKGYEKENARIKKARAEIAINTLKQAERESVSDVITHEYGHFIHRHANTDYVQKKNVYGAKELGGKMMGGDWKYDINTQYSTAGMINASKISKYATENPYETFAEGFLALDKGEKIPSEIETVIKGALERSTKGRENHVNLQFFAKKHKARKVPSDDPLWDSLVKGNADEQMKDGIFEWEHGGYDYLIEIKGKYTYNVLSRKKKPNIHE